MHELTELMSADLDYADLDRSLNGRVSASGVTPLHRASGQGKLNTVSVLILYKSDVRATTAQGGTPLHWAAGSGHTGVVQLLIDHQAEVNAKDNRGDTALSRAVRWNRADTVMCLLRHGAIMGILDTDRTVVKSLDVDAETEVKARPRRKSKDLTVRTKNVVKPYTNPARKYVQVTAYMSEDGSEVLVPQYSLSDYSSIMSSDMAPYKKIDDTNQLRRSISPCNIPDINIPDQTLILGNPTQSQIYELSTELGHEWMSLAFALDLQWGAIDQCQRDHPHDSRQQNLAMLIKWRQIAQNKTETERMMILSKGLKNVGRNDLAKKLMA